MSSSEESGEIKYGKPQNANFNHQITRKIGEGTFGEVFESVSRNTKYALKKIPTDLPNGMMITTIREIKLLRLCSHQNIIEIKDIICDQKATNDRKQHDLYIVFPYYRIDLERYISNRRLSLEEIRTVTRQICDGVNYMHKKGIIHRDLKTANILLNDIYNIKICDFGLAKIMDKNDMTPGLVTLWYRAPEVLLGYKKYDEKIDIWSIGCILGEMCQGKPILCGRSEIEMLEAISYLCGTINERTCPSLRNMDMYGKYTLSQGINRIEKNYENYGRELIQFLQDCLKIDHHKRSSAEVLLFYDFLLDENTKKRLKTYA